jgi:hypothetical protein
MPRPYSAQRQRGIAAILRRRRSGSLRGGARHRAPVLCSAAAGHRCNPAPRAKRVSPQRGAASCARSLLSGSGASLQSCTAGEAGLPSAGRGIVRPSSAQRQRGIAAILRRRRSGSLLGGARHRAPVLCSAAAGHRCNPAPQRPRGAPAPAARSAESCSNVLCRAERHAGSSAWSRVGGLIVFPAASASGRSTTVLASHAAPASDGVGNSIHISVPPREPVRCMRRRGAHGGIRITTALPGC